MTNEEKLAQIEKEIKNLEEGYAEECAELTKQKGFDEYLPKWQKKINQIADKYSRLLYPLMEEHEEVRVLVNEEAENERKKKYIKK